MSSDILTNERKRTLDELYYRKGMVFGRDTLFALVKQERAEYAAQQGLVPTDPRLEAKFPSRRAIAKFLENQELQQLYRGQRKSNLVRGIPPVRPGHSLSVDLIDFSKDPAKRGKGDMWYILTVICNFSRYLFARKVYRKEPRFTSAAMALVLADAERVLGRKPVWVLCDKGTEFNQQFIELLEREGIQKKRTLPGAPQSNGIVERANGKLKMLLAKRKRLKGLNWVDDLQASCDAFNMMQNRTIKVFPKDAAAYRSPQDDAKMKQLRDNWNKAQTRNISKQGVTRFNNLVNQLPLDELDEPTKELFQEKIDEANESMIHRRKPDYTIGTRVRLKLPKGVLDKSSKPSWTTKIHFIRKVYPGYVSRAARYLVSGKDDDQKYTRNDLLVVRPTELVKITSKTNVQQPRAPPPGPAPINRAAAPPQPPALRPRPALAPRGEYTIERILDKRKRRNRWEYLVKWEGYPENEATWEPRASFTGAAIAIYQAYDQLMLQNQADFLAMRRAEQR